jgi:hypothetical protein
MYKRIEFFLLATVSLVTLVALLPLLLPLFTEHSWFEYQDNSQYAAYLQYQHLCGWLNSFFGIAFIAIHTFRRTNALPYEILDAKRLVHIVLLLLFLSLAYLSISMPFPHNNRAPLLPLPQFIITAVTVMLSALFVLAAIKRNNSPRALLILLIMYHLYFTSGVLLMGLLERNQPATFLGIFEMFQQSLLGLLTAATLVTAGVGLLALKKRHSVLDQIFIELKALNGIKAKAKKKEDSIKQSPLTPELTDALKALTGVLNPPPKPSPEDRLKISLSEALEKFATEMGKSHDANHLETRLKSMEEMIVKLALVHENPASNSSESDTNLNNSNSFVTEPSKNSA